MRTRIRAGQAELCSLSRSWGAGLLLWLSLVTLALGQPSLAPPHAELIEGRPVVVTAHPDQLSLLGSSAASLAANKALVHQYYRMVILGGQSEQTARFLSNDYIEHNPLLPSGRKAFTDYLADRLEAGQVPATVPDLVTIVAEGDYVVMALVTHYPEPDNSGSYTSTHFEMFRIANQRIAEHWDSTLFRAGQKVPDFGSNRALPVTGVAGTAQYRMVRNDDPVLFANKRMVYDLWRHIPEGGREELAALFMDPIYIQHNPNAATGRDGVVVYFSQRPDTPVETTIESPLVAMVAEGDLVVQVLETERERDGVTYKVPWFDMFRISGNRVIEHWDTASKGELPAIMESVLPLN